MCGIAGIIGYTIQENHLKAFQTLMYLTNLRGGDGMGAFSVTPSTQSKVSSIISIESYKDKDMTPEFAAYDETYKKVVEFDRQKRFIVGHCRAATKGEITSENNHPFETDELIGVHNGTLKAARWDKEGKTDSELLFEAISASSFQDVYDEIKEEPYTLVWYDKSTSELNLIRSKDRPLVFMKLAEDIIFFCSSADMLNFVAKHHNLNVKKGGFLSIKPDTLVKFDVYKTNVSEPIYVGPVVPLEKK